MRLKPVPGLCDICSLRWELAELREIVTLNTPTGIMACPDCWDPSHPQLDTRNLRTDDRQRVDRPRSDSIELDESRKISAWNPVGHQTTSTATGYIGRVRVVT